MTVTAHSLVAGSIAKAFPNPFLAIPLAIASNFLLDMIPHWDTGTNWRERPKIITFLASGADVLLGLAGAFLLFAPKVDPFYLLTVIFAASLPDWLEAPYIFLGWNFPPFSWIYSLQSRIHAKNGLPWGIITQVLVVTPILLLALGTPRF